MRRCAVVATTQNVEPADASGELTKGDGQKCRAAGNVRRLGRNRRHRHRIPAHPRMLPGHTLNSAFLGARRETVGTSS
jgi:hypothetical protein